MDKAKRKLIQRTIIYGFIILFIIIYVMLCLNGLGLSCIYEKTFHMQCPSCGATRAFLSIVSLDFTSAIAYHPIFTLVFYPFVFILVFQDYLICLYNVIKHKKVKSLLEYVIS